MKHLILRLLAIIPFLAALGTTSCIYDAPGDRFYRTLWKSTPEPLGSFQTGELTVEFLCDNKITIKDSGTIIAHGTYTSADYVATFSGLELFIDDVRITFIEAHRNGDTLFLLWRPDDRSDPYTVSLDRLSAYE